RRRPAMRRTWWLLPALLVTVAPPASGGVVEQDRYVATSAGAIVASGSVQLEVLAGDIAIGESATGGTDLWHGFWAPLPPPAASVPPSVDARAFFAAPCPNPAAEALELRFGLVRAGLVRLAIHDLEGRCIRTL